MTTADAPAEPPAGGPGATVHAPAPVEKPASTTDWREFTAVVLLAVTAIVTAWTGFQASKWGGAMSISFSQASTARIEAARLEAVANRKQSVQVSLFGQWLAAYQADDEVLADFLAARFPEPLATTFPVWLESKPLKNPDAPSTPFEMEEYAIPELADSAAADARADSKYAEALRNNQRGDNYTVLTVAFATILFFGAMSGRMRNPRAQWGFIIIGAIGFVICAGLLLFYPKLV
ncbi:hypothetical protein [Nocardioides sambongensis]|uniref:hypothetical protein n=1 Tax=Nocardioides sambongensis TaxID=2589074 RepID=UPI0011282265|nr:hypothetical protein [Nocardioides sambongensis]